MSAWVELWVRLKVVDLVAQTAWLTLTEKLDFGERIHGLLRYAYWGFTAGGEPDTLIDEIDRAVRLDSAFTNQNKHRYRLMIVEGVAGRGVPFGDDGSTPPVDLSAAAPSSAGAAGRSAAADARGPRADGMHAPPGPAPHTTRHRGDLPLEHDYAIDEEVGGATRNDLFALDCLVRERDGEREAGFTDRLNGLMSGVTVSEMKAGEVWRIIVSARNGAEALETAGRIAVTRSRREGLLLNPHYQRLELIAAVSLPPRSTGNGGERERRPDVDLGGGS